MGSNAGVKLAVGYPFNKHQGAAAGCRAFSVPVEWSLLPPLLWLTVEVGLNEPYLYQYHGQ